MFKFLALIWFSEGETNNCISQRKGLSCCALEQVQEKSGYPRIELRQQIFIFQLQFRKSIRAMSCVDGVEAKKTAIIAYFCHILCHPSSQVMRNAYFSNCLNSLQIDSVPKPRQAPMCIYSEAPLARLSSFLNKWIQCVVPIWPLSAT